jgi:hypothetical protein
MVWKTWSFGAAHDVSAMYGVGGHPPVRGVVIWGNRRTTVDYPPVTLYGLAAVGRVYGRFDSNYDDSVVLTILIKVSIVAMESLLSFFLWRLVQQSWGPQAARAAVVCYWLNPAVFMDGPVLGYLDSWAAAPAVAAIAAGAGSMPLAPILCGIALAVAVMTKVQAIFAVPVAGLVLWAGKSHRSLRMLLSVGSFTAAVTVMVLPFMIRGALPNVVQGVSALLRHDMLSGTAANLWWIVTWVLRASYAVQDLGVFNAWTMTVPILGISRTVELGYPNPRLIGALMTAGAVGWAFWRGHRAIGASTTSHGLGVALAAGAFAVHAYFVLAVQVHENHLYLALPLLAAAAAALPLLRPPLVALSAISALNLWLFYGFGRDFPLPPRHFTILDATVVLSALNVAALVWHGRRFAASSLLPPAS